MFNNSIQEIIDVLNEESFLPENEIMNRAFDFDRSSSQSSNKKYADMLRRGLEKGFFKRCKLEHPLYPRCRYFYYIPNNLG